MRRNRKAKIVATLGPASSDKAVIKQLFEAGVDVFRLNFSHGSHEDHAERYRILREIEAETGRPVGILQDLQGPKIRIGQVCDDGIELVPGETVRFDFHGDGQSARAIPLPHMEVISSALPGHQLLIDDGRLRLVVTACEETALEAEVIYGGLLTSRKGINLPDTMLDLSPLTEKDRADLAFGLELGVDWIALSFVQRANDVLELQNLVQGKAGIIAKIEKPLAMTNIEGIIDLSDAIMVARGDLGVELPPEDVPGCQKELIKACRLAGKPVIVATQMLDSMTNSPQPTRAEASDIATAIFDGADAVMLSGESAAGKYPLEAVTFMDRVLARTETHKTYRSIIKALEPAIEPTVQHSVAAAAELVAERIDASVILAYTTSGATASRITRMRPSVHTLVVSPELSVVRRMTLHWGAHTVQMRADITTFREMVDQAKTIATEEAFAKAHDHVVIVAGVPFGVVGSTNNLRVIQV